MLSIQGLIAAPFTPMHPNGQVHDEQIQKLAAFLAENRVQGGFINGSTGEGHSLTWEEKKRTLTSWAHAKPDDFTLIAMVGGDSLFESIELAQWAQNHQYDAIALVAPSYFGLESVEALVAYCQRVTEKVPDMPFFYYHIPGLSGAHFSMTHFLALAESRIPNLAGIKFSHANLMELNECIRFGGRKYTILWGRDQEMVGAWAMGARGFVGSTYNYMAPLYHDVIDALQAQQWDAAEQLLQKSIAMVRLLDQYGGIAPGKAFMKMAGVDCGQCRPPIRQLREEDWTQLQDASNAIGFAAFCSQVTEAK